MVATALLHQPSIEAQWKLVALPPVSLAARRPVAGSVYARLAQAEQLWQFSVQFAFYPLPSLATLANEPFEVVAATDAVHRLVAVAAARALDAAESRSNERPYW